MNHSRVKRYQKRSVTPLNQSNSSIKNLSMAKKSTVPKRPAKPVIQRPASRSCLIDFDVFSHQARQFPTSTTHQQTQVASNERSSHTPTLSRCDRDRSASAKNLHSVPSTMRFSRDSRLISKRNSSQNRNS